jgi:hypothetical protein
MLIVIFSGFFGMYVSALSHAHDAQPRECDALGDARGNRRDRPERTCARRRHRPQNPRHRSAFHREHQLGGNVWTQLRARDGSDLALTSLHASVEAREKQKQSPTAERATMFAMVDFLAGQAVDKQSEALRKLIDMISRKKRLATRVARDIQYQAMMEIWLYFHVPISFGLLAALIGHIVSSFFYW